MPENSSEILLERYLSGHESAPFELHERYGKRLIGLVRRRLLGTLTSKIDPEDIAQETFIAFFNMAESGAIQWQERGDLWRLIAGIAANKSRMAFEFFGAAKRQAARELPLDGKIGDPQAIELSEEAYAATLNELLEDLLDSQTPLLRRLLTLRLAGYSQQEISEKLGRSVRTVRRLLDSLKAKLVIDAGLPIAQTAERPKNPVVAELAIYSDFQLLRFIGMGSFAKVYLAKSLATNELFAIKAIRKKWILRDDAQEAFVKESRLLLSIVHPNIIRLHGLGRLPNGGHFLVLDLVEGSDWQSSLTDASPSRIFFWICQLADAIRFLHSKNISHGDLRSENVLIDNDGDVRVVDFGLATRLPDCMASLLIQDVGQFVTLLEIGKKSQSGHDDNADAGSVIDDMIDACRDCDAITTNDVDRLKQIAAESVSD